MKKRQLIYSLSVSIAAAISSAAFANPDINGATIVNGQVSFSSPAANTLQINNSNGAIINWQSFSIDAGEVTHFNQSGATSTVLNQVTGGNVSNIFGSLTSNGQVYLINPAGIVFGQNSIVNTAGFIASTLNLSNQDFLEGKLNFEGVNAGDILNQGFITAGANGDIALIAPNIVNEGVISVEQGDVILAAGEKVTLASLDASSVGFEVQSDETSVTNLGSVVTDGGAVGMFAATLKHEGTIEANALTLDENGNVILVAKNELQISDTASVSANGEDGGRVLIQTENGTTLVSGTVEAIGENGKGGVVDVLGHQVGLIDGATITADGKNGGGEIHIGGNYQGKGMLQNASAAFVGQDVSISADAIESGDGGEVIVWADGASRVYGSISATGGELFGNGGFVETSGKAYLDVTDININLVSVNGDNGEWLLDPFNLTIGSGGDQFISGGPNFESLGSGSNLNVDTLTTLLNAGTDVTVNTGTLGGELGDITIATPILVTGAVPVSLTLEAENDINVNFSITASNAPLNLSLNADSNYNLGADGTGSINVNALINTNGGNATFNAASGITFNEFADLSTGLGTITLNTINNDITLGSQSVDATDLTSSAGININAGGSLVMNNLGLAPTISSTNSNISIIANDVVLTGTVNAGTGNLLISSGFGLDMDIGAFVAAGFVLDATEVSLLTAGAFSFGQNGIGSININSTLDLTTALTLEGANISFNQGAGSGINSSADVSLIAAGSIIDNAPGILDVIATNITLDAQSGIGDVNPLEIQMAATPGLLSFSNANGNVQIINTAVSPSDVMRVTGDNFGLGGTVFIENNIGITDVSGAGITSNAGPLKLTGLQINVNALLDNNNFVAPVAMELLADEIEINANLFSTSGGILLSNLNLGGIINFAATSNATADLDFAQTEISFLNSPSVDFGELANTSDMIFSAPINFGAMNVSFNAGADIQFSQGLSTAILTTGNVKLDSAGVIVGQAVAVVDIDAAQLDFTSSGGFGSTLGDAIEVNVGLLQGTDTGGSIYIDSVGPLTTGVINASGSLPVWIEVNGDLTLATINANGGNVLLDTTSATNGLGGGIFDDTVATNNINGANILEMYSETGIGTLTDPVSIVNITSSIFADVVTPGSIYIDNQFSGLAGSLLLDTIQTSAGEIVINNFNTNQTTDIVTLISAGGNLTIDSNSDININNNVDAIGGNINLRVVGGTGTININSAITDTTGTVDLNTVSGDILFGALGSISSQAINLTASGLIDDQATNAAIGFGTEVSLLTVSAGGNIVLDGASNDAAQISLSSTGGSISYTDVGGFLLDAAYATADGTGTGALTGNVTLNSGGAITDVNGATVNIAAVDAIVNSVNGIGMVDGIETRIGNSLSFNNSADGTVHFNDLGLNNVQVFGVNNSVNSLTTDFTMIQSQNGSLTVSAGQTLSALATDLILDVVNAGGSLNIGGTVSVSNVGNEIDLLAPVLNVTTTGSVNAPGTIGQLSVLLRVDDLSIAAGGNINGGVGDLAIENLTNGNTISIGGASGNLQLSAIDLAGLTAGRMSIGQNGGTGNDAGGIIVEGAVNLVVDTKLASSGDIVFNQGAAINGITSTANLELNTTGAIIDLSAGGYDVAANGLSLVASNGIGALDAIDTQVTGLQISNATAGDINIDNTSAGLSIAFANQNALAANLSITSSGNIDFIDNTVDAPGITSANGSVILVSGGSIQDAGITVPHVAGANDVTLNSSAGVGLIGVPIELQNIGTGGLSAYATTGNIYIDHIVGGLTTDFVISALTSGSGIVEINNQNAAQDMRIGGPVTINGGSLLFTSPSTMFVDSNITDNGVGTIDLQVTGAGGNLFITTGTVFSNGGNISLTANTDITLNGSADISNVGGLTSLTATNGVLSSITAAGITGGGNLNASALNGINLQGNNNVNVLALSTTNNNIDYFDVNDVALGLISASQTTGGITISSAGHILDGNTTLNNITASTLTLNATNGVGTLADPLETSVANFIQFSNSTANGVYIVNSVPSNVLLNGSNASGDINITYDGNILLQTLNAAGDISLTSSNGNIQDSFAGINLTANNISLQSFGFIGGGDPINSPSPVETQLNGTTGSISATNTSSVSGHIEVQNLAINTTDTVTFSATNNATAGGIYLLNPQGISTIGNVTSQQGEIELKALELSLNGAVSNSLGSSDVLLLTDDFDVVAGTVNANTGNIYMYNITDGRVFTLGGTAVNTFDLVQADINALTAVNLGIGVKDTVTPFGSGDINVVGSLDFGTLQLSLESLGNINFNNGVSTGLTSSSFMVFATEQAITSDASTGTSIVAPNLSIYANNGIGSLNPLRTQSSTITLVNNFNNNVQVSNTGNVTLFDSANFAGDLSVKSDGILTLSPNSGIAGTTGAVANNKLTLEGAGGVVIDGVLSATAIDLFSQNGININDTVTASGFLHIDSDTDMNGIGDLTFENTTGGTLRITANNMNLHGANIYLYATFGAVNVASNNAMNLVSEADLVIMGGETNPGDAYLSSRGPTIIDVGGSLTLSGGSQSGSRAAIFDETGANTNNLALTVAGDATLTGGLGNLSGAIISVANLDMSVGGSTTLTGGAGSDSPAVINSSSGIMRVATAGTLTLVDGIGLNSPARIISNAGYGFLDVSYTACIGCDTGLKFLSEPVNNTASGEVVYNQNTLLGTEPLISSSDALMGSLDGELLESGATLLEYFLEGGTRPPRRPQANQDEENEQESTTELERPAPVMVCR